MGGCYQKRYRSNTETRYGCVSGGEIYVVHLVSRARHPGRQAGATGIDPRQSFNPGNTMILRHQGPGNDRSYRVARSHDLVGCATIPIGRLRLLDGLDVTSQKGRGRGSQKALSIRNSDTVKIQSLEFVRQIHACGEHDMMFSG